MNRHAFNLSMAFVVAVRLIIFGIAQACATPIIYVKKRLPESDTQLPYLDRLKAWLIEQKPELPDWIEYRGDGKFLVQRQGESDRLNALVSTIPERLFTLWQRYSIAIMTLFVLAWGVILLVSVGAWASATIGFISAAIDALTSVDLSTLLNPNFGEQDTTYQFPSIAELAREIVKLVGLLAVITVLYWLSMLFLLPGLTLHEFGHYAAIKRAGGEIDRYGLLFVGPYPMGAFVDDGGSINGMGMRKELNVWAGGIANTALWGTLVLAIALVIVGNPLSLLESLAYNDYNVILQQPIGVLFLVLAVVEVYNIGFNTIPFGPVDGGGFIQAIEYDWFGVEREDPFTVRIRSIIENYRYNGVDA